MKLTENFLKTEFDSRDGAPMPDAVLKEVKNLATQLQALRNHLGKPININSGYRSPAYNRRVGGAVNSQHLIGKAADIRVFGAKPEMVAQAIELLIAKGAMGQGGIGIYNTFVHYDTRGKKARWDFRK